MCPESEEPRPPRHYRYLPLLSLALVALSIFMLVKLYMRFPRGEHAARVEAFDTALRLIPERYAGATSQEELYEAAMRGMVQSLNDPFTVYLNKYQLQNTDAQTEGEFGGVGIVVSPRDGGGIIIEIQEDSPAASEDVRPGDLIVAVDGRRTEQMTFVEMVSRIRGKVGTKVKLSLQRAGSGDEVEIALERARILLESVQSRVVDSNIGYVQVNQFDMHCVEDVKGALEGFQEEGKVKGVILDLRGNSGGLLSEAVNMSDLFLSSGNIAHLSSDIDGGRLKYEAHAEVAIPEDTPLVVLVDHRSASASEVTAAALKSHGRATIVGVRTYGKGVVNRVFVLPDGTGLLLTIAHYKAGKGVEIQGKGVEPDIEVGRMPPPPEGEDPAAREKWLEQYRRGQREQFDRAVAFLKEKLR